MSLWSVVLPLLRDPIPKTLVTCCARAPAQQSLSSERGGEMLSPAPGGQAAALRRGRDRGRGPSGHHTEERHSDPQNGASPPSGLPWQQLAYPLRHLLEPIASASPAQWLSNWKWWQQQQEL